MKKKALVLSGGGSRGAFQIGAIKALFESGRKYDVVSGVSVGALNAAFIAQYNKEEQVICVEGLEKIWLSLSGDGSVYRPHAPGFLKYIWAIWKGGLNSMEPLRTLIKSHLDIARLQGSNVELDVGVVCLNDGLYHSINKRTDDISDFIWASCIFPILMSPAVIKEKAYVDGGVRRTIPLHDVFVYDIDEVDVVITAPKEGYFDETSKKLDTGKFSNILHVGSRSAGIMSDQVFILNLREQCACRGIKLNVFEPEENMTNDGFDFSIDKIKSNMEMGHLQTKKKLKEEK